MTRKLTKTSGAKSILGLLKQLGMGAGIGAGLGGGVYLTRSLADPPQVLQFPETTTALPLTPAAGPLRAAAPESASPSLGAILMPSISGQGTPKKTTSKKEKEKPDKKEQIKKSAVTFAHLLGAGLGLGGGYKGLEYYADKRRATELNKIIDQRTSQLAKLLLSEQTAAASGMAKKSAEPLFLGQSIKPHIESLRKMYTGMRPSARMLFGALALGGITTSGLEAFRRGVLSDKNRAVKKKLRASLVERLTSSGERDKGIGRSPMITKLRPTRIGVTPLKPGASALVEPSAGRDALMTL